MSPSLSPMIQQYTKSKDISLPSSRAVVVVLLFCVHGKQLRSCRDGQLTMGRLRPLKQYLVHILSRVTDNCPS